MIVCEFWYRSRGMRWPLRPGDAVILRDGLDELLEIDAELATAILIMHFYNLQLTEHLRSGTAPRRSLAKMLSNEAPPSTKDLLEQRRLKRKKRA